MMLSLFSLKLFSCFGVSKKRKRPGTNMKEVFQSGSLAPFKIKKAVRFKQDEDVAKTNVTDHLQPESIEGAKEDASSAPSHKPKVIQGVNPDTVLVDGTKCRSQLKCKGRPGGYAGLGCSVALGEYKHRK